MEISQLGMAGRTDRIATEPPKTGVSKYSPSRGPPPRCMRKANETVWLTTTYDTHSILGGIATRRQREFTGSRVTHRQGAWLPRKKTLRTARRRNPLAEWRVARV